MNRGPAPMRNIGDWQQRDSDHFAHLIQVSRQISESRWSNSEARFTSQGDKTIDAEFPDIEAFVYAAVYFRQLCTRPDSLFENVSDRYMHFVDYPGKLCWVAQEKERFLNAWRSPAFMLPEFTIEQLLRAFMYGASILHSIPHDRSDSKKHFHQLVANYERAKVLYALNSALKQLQNHVSALAAVVYQDFAHWLNRYSLPLPDVIWHFSLFHCQTESQTAS